MAMSKVEPVCAEPKVFVGQLPDEASQGDVQGLFQQYGAISECSLIKGPDGRGRGFAMVQFQKWRDAEAAIEHLNGTTSLGGNRTLVVKVADPPKRGGAAVGGIVPKRLFIGQIPSETDEAQLRTLFEQYGFIKDMHLVRKSQPWFAFVTFDKWAEAEMAVEALNGQTTLPNARSPLVVKFADGKPAEGAMIGGGRSGGEKRALGADSGVPQKRQFMGSEGGAMMGGFGMMGYNPVMGGGMGNGRMMGRMGGMGAMGGMSPMGMGAMGLGAMGALGMGAMGMGNGMGGYGMGGMPPMSMPMTMPMPSNGMGGSPQQMRNNGGGRMGVGPPGLPNAAARQWKLFVGQVPFEATEADLWQLFGPLGDIVELVVLRHPGTGKSRGCAFVSYCAKESAQMAIDTIHEQQALPGRDKVLVVKYANN